METKLIFSKIPAIMADIEHIGKPVPGYEGHYTISESGAVFNLWSKKVLKATIDKDGYYAVGLRSSGTKKTFKIHRLVALVYIENPLNKPEVNHKDTNPANNHFSNLEWATRLENVNHSLTEGNRKLNPPAGTKNSQSKLTERDVHGIRALRSIQVSYSKIATQYGVTIGTIWKITSGKTWTHI